MAEPSVYNGREQTEDDSVQTYGDAFPPLSSPVVAMEPSSHAPVKSLPVSNVTQVFHVPLEERRFKELNKPFGGETRQTQIVKEVMQKTGCNIEVCQAKDMSLSIMVTGRPEAVLQARKLILNQLQTQAFIDIQVPKGHHKFVLGKSGNKLKGIENMTATKITVPKSEDPSDTIKISGTKEGIDRARHEILTISEEQAKLAFEVITVEKVYHPFINGPNGSRVKSLADQTGTRINMPPPSVKKDDITISGEKDGVAEVAKTIKKQYEELKRACGTVSVEVKKSQHKYVVGPKGHSLQEILEETGVSVELPPSDSDSCTVTLRGPQEKLGTALSKVYEKANSIVCEEIKCPHWLHRFVIGRDGSNIKSIITDLPKVHLEFSHDQDVIILEGPQAEVKVAREKLESFTSDLMDTMDFVEVSIPSQYHRHIIGRGGANINRIKKETGTAIMIPSDGNQTSVIRIEGDPRGVAAAKTAILDLVKKIENERAKDVIIEQRFHSKIIGAGGENIQELKKKFPDAQVNFPRQKEKSDIVQVRGPKDQVEGCSTALKKMSKELVENNFRMEVKVFKKFHGSIIGKGGSNLKKIRQDTNTKIDLPTEKSDSEYIVITGRRENVERAREKILAMERQLAAVTEATISIPQKHHNAIIGPKGRLVRSIMDEYGVRISFPQSAAQSNEVKIQGPKEDVEKAKECLLEMAKEIHLDNYSEEIKCKAEYHKFLIGKNGSRIKKVRDEFGARVIFPQKLTEDDPETITILGREKKVIPAKAHIEKMIADLEKIVEDQMDVDPKHHKYFIQKRGQVIKEIADENGGIIISFPKQGSGQSRVLLKGAAECIQGAKDRIKEIIEDLEAQITMECTVSHKHHRSIMGPRGSNIQQVTEDHNVHIKFPERNRDSQSTAEVDEPVEEGSEEKDPRDLIIITGRKEDCEAAKEAILSLVPTSVEVPVPNEYHRYIIGQQGREVRALMDEFRVQITIPSPDKQLDIITITGPPSHVEEAIQAVKQKVQQLEAEKEDRELRSYKEILHVDPKHHPKIIGRKGAQVKEIRQQFGVQIQFPEKDSQSQDVIEITGYEHQVKDAKDAIMKIVEELEEQITVDVEIDHRVHSRLIGQRGKTIAKVMEKYHVDIRFPRDKSSNVITITGLEENVEDAKEDLLTKADDFMEDVRAKEEERELESQYTKRSSHRYDNQPYKGQGEFRIRDGPWEKNFNMEEFPAIGTAQQSNNSASSSSWGPKKGK